jgi:hypothetical protein
MRLAVAGLMTFLPLDNVTPCSVPLSWVRLKSVPPQRYEAPAPGSVRVASAVSRRVGPR